jgi:redox-sensing transcriptional repressor
MDITRISSKELSTRMGITASQIRQDLNCFGGFGQQGYGYNVEFLYNEIGNILGINNRFKTIIIGAGNMGQALANYGNFERRGFRLTGIFDVDENLIGNTIREVKIMHMDSMDDFIKEHKIDIAILAVPYEQTPLVAERVAKLGIKALWNFSPMDLKLQYDVVIENVHLSDSLMVLGYKLNEKYKNRKG